MPNIALFGTSADPPTTGHRAILSWLSWHFDWVAVWASDNPFKSHQTPLSHRMAMLQLLIEDIQPSRHNIHLDPELGCSRTYYTLKLARERWKNAELTFVIGSDLIFQLPNWYRVDEVLKQVDLLVIPRPGYSVKDSALAELRRRGARIAITDLTGPDISSSAYREGGETEGLTPPIKAYIHREQLYAWQDASREKQSIR